MKIDIGDVKQILEYQREIIVDLSISSMNVKRIIDDGSDVKEQIKKHGFFVYHIYQLRFILIIQLSKIFSQTDNDKISFYKLCNKLRSSSYGSEMQKMLFDNQSKFTSEVKSRKDILLMVDEILALLNEHNDSIKRVISLRNKVYAHTDIEKGFAKVSYDELIQLTILAKKIYNIFSFRIFFTTFWFDEVRPWDIDYVLCQMAEKRKIDLERISNQL